MRYLAIVMLALSTLFAPGALARRARSHRRSRTTPTYMPPSHWAPPPEPPATLGELDAEVIIIGAGWSGMSAAHQLALHNVSFIVLEARDYTGGRTHSMQFGDANSVGQFTMELGSGWLETSGHSGGPSRGPPPVSAAAAELGLKVAFVPGSTQNQSNYIQVLTPDGKRGDADGKIRRAANAAYECLNKTARHLKDDISVRKGLTECHWTPKTPVERAVDWGLTVDDPGLLADVQSLMSTVPDEVYEWWGPDDRYIIDQHPRGYARVLDYITRDTVPPSDPRIVLNTKVTNIAYDASGVTVKTAGGKTYKASVAISSFPFGVLQRKHRELLTPNIPSDMRRVIERGHMVMSNLTRIYLQFPTVFWDNSAADWLVADESSPGEFPEFRNQNHKDRVPGSNTLLLFIANPESIKYESMSDKEVQNAVMAKLNKVYQNVPTPVAFYMTRWGLDPLAYGCYSGYLLGFDDDDYEVLNTPLSAGHPSKSRVYQIGEAMCDDLSGSTYGAYQSGLQTAQSYLHETGRIKHKPLDLCYY